MLNIQEKSKQEQEKDAALVNVKILLLTKNNPRDHEDNLTRILIGHLANSPQCSEWDKEETEDWIYTWRCISEFLRDISKLDVKML